MNCNTTGLYATLEKSCGPITSAITSNRKYLTFNYKKDEKETVKNISAKEVVTESGEKYNENKSYCGGCLS